MYRLLGLIALVVMLCPGVALALVNINTAGLNELKTLTGIGDVKAQTIIDYRNNNGPFSTIQDIMKVSGIGTATFESIKNSIAVSGGVVTDVEDEDNKETENVIQTTSSSSSGDKTVHEPVSGLTVTAPNVGYVGQLLKFDIEPKDGTKGRLVRYSWNFGDGEVSDEKSPKHQYLYPGTYVLIVESYFQKETKTVRKELTILPLDLVITPLVTGGVEVTNNGSHEVDLSGMVLSGAGDFVFPNHTILLAGKSVVLRTASGPNVSLKDEFGKPLAVGSQKSATLVSGAKAPVPPPASARTATVSQVATSSVDIEPVTIRQAAAVSDAGVPADKWPYLGLFAVVGFGFVALFGLQRD